jgi:Beta-fructosidases (levanase/invertase)
MGIQQVFLERIPEVSACFEKVFQTEGRYVNDHCFVCKGDEIHLFYIDGEVGKGPYVLGNEITIGHAVSNDLHHWSECRPALVRDEMLDFEERGIFAPYIVKRKDLYYMYYSSHNIQGAQFMCLATSKDLFEWRRFSGKPLFYPSTTWAEWEENIPCSCRDPHIFYDEDQERYVMLWVADIKDQPFQSCIAASYSRDLIRWKEIGPILVRKHSRLECFTMKTESPCLIKKDGLFYLFYRHGNGTKYCISENYNDFTYGDSYYLGPCHASEIFNIDEEWYISSCSREVGDIFHNYDRTSGLWIAKLSWEGMHPHIAEFR